VCAAPLGPTWLPTELPAPPVREGEREGGNLVQPDIEVGRQESKSTARQVEPVSGVIAVALSRGVGRPRAVAPPLVRAARIHREARIGVEW
jgi:hypothetical protein